jgi:hypothetical protein
MIPRLAWAAVRTTPMPYRLLKPIFNTYPVHKSAKPLI